jgi:AraC-like DNA-binding protein
VTHFSRIFRNHYDTTPREYRNARTNDGGIVISGMDGVAPCK